MTQTVFRPHSWSVEKLDFALPDGLSIAEMVACYPTPLPPEFAAHGVVLVNGEPVPRQWWGRVRPKGGTPTMPVVVSLHLVPGGGGLFGGSGGGKQIAQLLGSIALIAAVAFIGGGGLAFLGPLFLSGGLGASLAAAGLGIAGQLALKALAPPPVAGATRGPGKTVSAGVGVNSLTPLAGIPTVLGKMLLSPPALIPPYTELKNGIVYSNTIVGLAGRHLIENIRLNDAPIGGFKSVQYQTREGAANDGKLTLNAGTVLEEALYQTISIFDWKNSEKLTPYPNKRKAFPDWHLFRSRGIAQTFRIRINYPGGLYYKDSAADFDPAEMFYRLQMRRVGQTAWITLPTVSFAAKKLQGARQEIRLRWVSLGSGNSFKTVTSGGFEKQAFWENLTGADTESPLHDEIPYVTDANFDSGVASGSFSHECHNVAQTPDSIDILLPKSIFPLDVYEIRIKQGAPYPSGGALDPLEAFLAYGVPLRTEFGPGNFNAAAIIESVSTGRKDYPLGKTNGLTLIAIKSRNIAINALNAEFTTICNIYSGGNWNSLGPTQNPAELFRHVLTSPLNAEPLDTILIDDANLQAWRSECLARGLTCNAVVQDGSVEQALYLTAAAGHAAVQRADKWGVIIEKSRSADAIVQVFSPRNTANNAVARDFDTPVDGLKVSYFDAADTWKLREQVIYDDGVQAVTASNIEAITYDGLTSLAEVKARAKLDLRQRRLRPVKYTFETDSQFLVSKRGDLVGYTFDTLDRRSDAGWVKTAEYDGANLTGLTLDATILLNIPANFWMNDAAWAEASAWDAGAYPGILLRRNNGTISSHRIRETTATTRVTLKTAAAIPQADVVGALVVGGVMSRHVRRCVVFDIEPRDDMTARVTLVDEAPGIHR